MLDPDGEAAADSGTDRRVAPAWILAMDRVRDPDGKAASGSLPDGCRDLQWPGLLAAKAAFCSGVASL